MAKRARPFGRQAFLKHYVPLLNDQTVHRQRFDFPRKKIEPLMAKSCLSFEEKAAVGSASGFLASYYAIQGIALCFSEPDAGWRLMRQSLLYRFWDMRISRRAWDFWEVRPGRRKEWFREAYILSVETSLSRAIAPSEARWYLDLLESSLTDGSLDWKFDNVFPAYLSRLDRKRKGGEDLKGVPLHPKSGERVFGDLIDSWDDEERLAQAIRQMCDYHLVRNQEATGEQRIEFGVPLAVLNPVEIHALEAVRSELGLSTPRVEHELLQPPFYPIPESAKRISAEEIYAEDPLLARIVELNQPWCDGLEDVPESPQMKDAHSASEPPEEPAAPSGNQVYQSDGITITSVSGDLTEETISVGKGLARVLSFAPLIENHVAAGRIEEAIRLFQEVSGASREEAEASIMREKNRHDEG